MSYVSGFHLVIMRSIWRSAVFNLLLRAAHRSIHSVLDLVHSLSSVKFRLHDLISLQEALQFVGELVILLGDEVDVSVEGLDLTGLLVRLIDLLSVVILHDVQLVLEGL